jgi:hypothetical protein
MQLLQQRQVRFHFFQGFFLEELFEVFVKMAVVVVAVLGEIKGGGGTDQVFGGFADTHDLQGLLGTDAGIDLKITLQGTG